MTKNNAKQSLRPIIELLLQPYPIDPGSLEFLIEEATNILPDGPVRIVFEMLNSRDNASYENMEKFITRSITNRELYKYFYNSTKPGGRCPSARKEWLKRLLELNINTSEVTKIPISNISESVRTFGTLDLSDIAGGLDELPVVLERISHINNQ